MVSFKVNRSLLAGTLATIGASVCCVGPLALLMLGISGAWIAHLSAFEPFRPWFVAATLLFLGRPSASFTCKRRCVSQGFVR